jgi:hypothetical protein
MTRWILGSTLRRAGAVARTSERSGPRIRRQTEGGISMDGLVQIVVIVLIVLFVLGYFGRGRFRA